MRNANFVVAAVLISRGSQFTTIMGCPVFASAANAASRISFALSIIKTKIQLYRTDEVMFQKNQ